MTYRLLGDVGSGPQATRYAFGASPHKRQKDQRPRPCLIPSFSSTACGSKYAAQSEMILPSNSVQWSTVLTIASVPATPMLNTATTWPSLLTGLITKAVADMICPDWQ